MADIQYLLAAYQSGPVKVKFDESSNEYLKKQKTDKETAENKIEKDDSVLKTTEKNLTHAQKRVKDLYDRIREAKVTTRKAKYKAFVANYGEHRRQAKEALKRARKSLKEKKGAVEEQADRIKDLLITKTETKYDKDENVQTKKAAEMHERNAISNIREQLGQINVVVATKELLDSYNINELPEHARDTAKRFLQSVKNGITVKIKQPSEIATTVQLAEDVRGTLSQKGNEIIDNKAKRVGRSYEEKAQLLEQRGNYSELDQLTDDENQK